MLTAKDVMTTEVITVTPATPIEDFARICSEDNISGAPVVRVDGSLVGIVSKTDLVQRLLEDHPKFGASDGGDFSAWDDKVRHVEDIMQTDVVTVTPDTAVPTMAARMAEDRVHRVVVVDGDQVAGIVTSLDLLRHFAD